MTDSDIIKALKRIPIEDESTNKSPWEYVKNSKGSVTKLTLKLTGSPPVDPDYAMALISQLTKLVYLSLEDLQVADISPLENLVNLKALDLTSNRISDLRPLQKLTGLVELDLYENLINDISPLRSLINLVHLNLRKNSQLADISSIRPLLNLKSLKFTDSPITDISALHDCKKLSTLWLESLKISNLYPLSGLTELEELIVYDCKIQDISPLKGLTKLSMLQLCVTRIEDLSPLRGMENLIDLQLENNQIKDISPLRNLKKLTQLELRGNPIAELPFWITDFDMEIAWKRDATSGITLFENPLINPPPEIIQKGREAIKLWFESDRIFVNETKVLLVGHGEVGKTTLVKCLTGEEPDPNEPTTHHIRISSHTIEHGGKSVKLNFWDFGGQEVMHSTHQFFLSTRSIYLLVLDGRKDEDAEYWLKLIESFGGNSPVLVVLNKVDANRGYDIDRRFLKQKYPFILDFYKTVCLGQREGIGELTKGLKQALDNVEILSIPWPRPWLSIKESLEDMQDDFISQGRYEKLCDDNGVPEGIAKETLAEYLNDLGVVVHFKDLRLNDFHILQPRWASRAAYKIINARIVADNHGLLRTEWLKDIMRKADAADFDYKKHTFPYILDLMQKFELCYPIEDGGQYLLPELMDIQQPELPLHQGPTLRFFFKYEDLLPRSILPRFIVRMHEDIAGELRWRTGVVLSDETFNSTAIVIADTKERRIDITVSGIYRREYFGAIRRTFYSLHKAFEKLVVTEWIPLPGAMQHAVKYKNLLGHEKAGKSDYFDGDLEKTFVVKDLLDGIEHESVRREEYKWDVFLCHASADKPIIRKIAHDLKERGIQYWLDEEKIDPGDNFIDKITDALQRSRNILPCISKNQLTSGWSKAEYQNILVRMIGGTSHQRIIPVILDETSYEEFPLFLSGIRGERYEDAAQYQRLLDFLSRKSGK
jgi:internalin A